MGIPTRVVKNPHKQTALNDLGSEYPPSLWVIIPPTNTPKVGPVMQAVANVM